MPLARYFSWIGGILLALLFISDAYLPKSPVPQLADANLPVIRIHSERKWPARVVYDTSLPTISPPQTTSANAGTSARAAVADVPPRVEAPEAFAQMRPSDVQQLNPSAPKTPDAKLQRQRKVAKKRVTPPMMLVAQQPHFGWFGNRW